MPGRSCIPNAILAGLLLCAASAAAQPAPVDAAALGDELLRCADLARRDKEGGLACYEDLAKSVRDRRKPVQAAAPAGSTSLTLRPNAPACGTEQVLFEADSANSIGWTKSNDDVGFMDVNLSVRAPLWYRHFADQAPNCGSKNFVYFGFDMRAGFYLGTRESSPFIPRWLNPSLHYRRFLDTDHSSLGERNDHRAQYWDIAYGHLSNGQTVDSATAFSEAATRLGNDDFARSYISRGWDYAAAKANLSASSGGPVLDYVTLSGEVKKFFGGFLQRRVEEFDSFEGPRSIMKLSQVRGIQLSSRLEFRNNPVSRNLTLTYDTGLNDAFKWNTVTGRLDLAFAKPLSGVPLALWVSNGYVSDLARYYRRASSGGLAFIFEANDR